MSYGIAWTPALDEPYGALFLLLLVYDFPNKAVSNLAPSIEIPVMDLSY